MLMKTALIALMGMTVMVEATLLPMNPVPMGLRLEARQNRGKQNNPQGKNNNQQQGKKNNNNGQGKNNNNNNGQGKNNNNGQGKNNNNNNGGGLCLEQSSINQASKTTGQTGGQIEPGQVESKTDNANFINFCAKKTLTDGKQLRGGSCSPVIQGDIPAAAKMVSTVIINPKNGDKIPAQKSFNVQVKIANMKLGSFTNAQNTYYTAPQQLEGGVVVGHTHVTIQDLGGTMNPTQPLNAEQFAFFKGINDAGDGNGGLQAPVDGGLPPGMYRLCSMCGASNHQPAIMPVAQRGAQDDCVRFEVIDDGGNGNGKNNNNGNGKNNNGNGKNNNGNGKNNNNGQQGKQQNQQQGKQQQGAKGKGRNAVGAANAPPVEDSGDSARPFRVNGETFVNRAAAVQRSCAIQNNACSDAVNSGGGGSLEACRQQEQACNANA
ncbi:hypothetical protein MGG_02851 [Pyricularia oryzae 70-15]|uniref:Ribosomal protein s17 n=1 Tax=Pyricularia oryzae (strain 70-15 / ATCC MYA-4617 / FGSC 8958) TaxID=242507 RepID=G4NLT9_PYRO7|nr:uncharacterized protein MGG_02851 [Pyricularia oryzae 70-15]EHA46142.1 hypothetical protein MGG_02851 [Pyricularia oryzae 70-15]